MLSQIQLCHCFLSGFSDIRLVHRVGTAFVAFHPVLRFLLGGADFSSARFLSPVIFSSTVPFTF